MKCPSEISVTDSFLWLNNYFNIIGVWGQFFEGGGGAVASFPNMYLPGYYSKIERKSKKGLPKNRFFPENQLFVRVLPDSYAYEHDEHTCNKTTITSRAEDSLYMCLYSLNFE